MPKKRKIERKYSYYLGHQVKWERDEFIMYKELIISAIIIVIIFFTDYITQKYTDSAINEAIKDISGIQEAIKQDDVQNDIALKNANEKYDKWLEHHNILAFYIEHNELEKVETNFVAGKSYIEKAKYEDANSELEKTKYVLEHINDKYSINWANIF